MSITVMNAAVTWWASDIPVLPSPVAMQWGLQASWSVVLAWLGAVLAARWTRGRAVPLGVAMALAVSAWLPGQASTSYWLGLAFQAPSVSAVLLCAALLRVQWVASWAGPEGAVPGVAPAVVAGGGVVNVAPDTALAALGVVLGWALLLDTFALLPVPLYAWGFSPIAAVVAVLLGWAPWLLVGPGRSVGWGTGVCTVAVLLFVLLRLPSGNLWDAVLDPWLWLALHMYVGRRVCTCYQKNSCLRTLDGR